MLLMLLLLRNIDIVIVNIDCDIIHDKMFVICIVIDTVIYIILLSLELSILSLLLWYYLASTRHSYCSDLQFSVIITIVPFI